MSQYFKVSVLKIIFKKINDYVLNNYIFNLCCTSKYVNKMLLEYKSVRGILSGNSDIPALNLSLPAFLIFIVFYGFYIDFLLIGNNQNLVFILFEKIVTDKQGINNKRLNQN